MGDENTSLSVADARHLLRRADFAVIKRDLDQYVGLTRGEAADKPLTFRPSKFEPRGRDLYDAQAKWLKKIVTTRSQLQEKMVLFWHDHFATNFATVQDSLVLLLKLVVPNRFYRPYLFRRGRSPK